jgi:hypothetical protein
MTAVRDVSKGVVVSRITRMVLLTAIAFFAAAPIASASPAKTLDNNLAALWTTVLETPTVQNSFGSGGSAFACWNLGRTVAPFAPAPVESCTVTTGTKLFVIGSSVECSTFEGNGTTEADLRTCAREFDLKVAPTISVDGNAVTVTEVETPLLEIVLPADNLFGQPAGTEGLSVAHGWVTLLQPLTPGTHTIVIGGSITTTIVVETGR